jgi:hypothetical protein
LPPSPGEATAGSGRCPRRVWFRCDGRRAHLWLQARENPFASACNAGGELEQTPHLLGSASRLFPSSAQVLPVVVPPSCATLLLYRWPRSVVLSLHSRTGHEEETWEHAAEASLTLMDLAEACIGLPELARQMNRRRAE